MTQDIDETLAERGKRYGRFALHAEVAQQLKKTIEYNLSGGRRLPSGESAASLAPDQKEALDMICHKIGRILCGDPDYADSWHDIAGYALLVSKRLESGEKL
jgi:hypothetical protein